MTLNVRVFSEHGQVSQPRGARSRTLGVSAPANMARPRKATAEALVEAHGAYVPIVDTRPDCLSVPRLGVSAGRPHELDAKTAADELLSKVEARPGGGKQGAKAIAMVHRRKLWQL